MTPIADDDDWTDGITIAVMAARFTPQQAARIKYKAAVMQLASVPDDRIERMLRWDPGHQWFLFCLDAVARRAI